MTDTFLFGASKDRLERLTPDERAQWEAVLESAIPRGTLRSKTYAYDQDGRLIEQREAMGALSEDTTTYRYDNWGNRIEERTEIHMRSMGVDENGLPVSGREDVEQHQSRFEYQYDGHGNWTERITWSQSDEQSDFQPASRERRTITYYAAQ